MDYFADVASGCVVSPDVCLHATDADEWSGDENAQGVPSQGDEQRFSETSSDIECDTPVS